jgi:hypothetical protein
MPWQTAEISETSFFNNNILTPRRIPAIVLKPARHFNMGTLSHLISGRFRISTGKAADKRGCHDSIIIELKSRGNKGLALRSQIAHAAEAQLLTDNWEPFSVEYPANHPIDGPTKHFRRFVE